MKLEPYGMVKLSETICNSSNFKEIPKAAERDEKPAVDIVSINAETKPPSKSNVPAAAIKNSKVETSRIGKHNFTARETENKITSSGNPGIITVLDDVKTSPFLSKETEKLVNEAENARCFLIKGNMPEDFNLKNKVEVDEGSIASMGKDAQGNNIWVVDQKVRYKECPQNLNEALIHGFFTGTATGKTQNGPHTKLLAVCRNGAWEEVLPSSNNDLCANESPFRDSSIKKAIFEVSGVRPLPGIGKLLPEGMFSVLVDTDDIKQGKNQCEMTLHFLNPEKAKGPFPGNADGAVRYRATRNPDGSSTMEGYYLTRGATEYVDPLSDFIPLGKTGKSLFSFGSYMFNMTPVGWVTGPIASAMGSFAGKVADKAIGATDAVRLSVGKFHAQFYRKVLFPNILGS